MQAGQHDTGNVPWSVSPGALLPTGTVSFLFTDIEGSTRLWQAHQSEMPRVIARHDAILRGAVESNHGVVFRTVGDAVYAAFESARDALAAALAGQKALIDEAWPEDISLRVRMAVHSGSADVVGNDYVGHALNRAARLLTAGHGGQILLSGVSQELVCDALPPDVELHDLGEHRLKDLNRPERVYEVRASGLPAGFPPLVTEDAPSGNLPAEHTPFIGREREMRSVTGILMQADVRLLTLTGPGGTGKTRLSLHVGEELRGRFRHGIFVVFLATVTDPALVPQAVAAAVEVSEMPGQSPLETLKAALRQREMLLILDNFEQVLAAAPVVADLLRSSPGLKVVVTSRAPLHLMAEHVFAVPPLEAPDPRHLPDIAHLSQYDAVALFIQRARAAQPDFAVTDENAPAVAEICYRLDGLPLAIELAASRIRLFSAQALLRRLERRLPLLTGGARDLPERQQTLRATLDWSYDLLDERSRMPFRRLAVFSGGWDLDAAEAVCNPLGDLDVLGALEDLVGQSLVQLEEGPDGEARFDMLQVVREYGLEMLGQAGETEDALERHAGYYMELAERSHVGFEGMDQELWLQRTEAEQDNFRAVLRYALNERKTDLAIRLCGALAMLYWYGSGQWVEGRSWLEQALSLPGARENQYYGRALVGVASLCLLLSDYASARSYAKQGLVISQERSEYHHVMWALYPLSWVAVWEGDVEEGRRLADEALALARDHGSPWMLANTLHTVGAIAVLQHDYETGQTYLEESVRLHRAMNDRWALGYEVNTLGDSYRLQGDYVRAADQYAQALQLFEKLKIQDGRVSVLHNLGYIALHQGDTTRAGSLFREALSSFRELGDRRGSMECIIGLGATAVQEGRPERAARLFAGGQRGLADMRTVLSHSNESDYNHYLTTLREMLSPQTFDAEWEAGASMPVDELVALALERTGA